VLSSSNREKLKGISCVYLATDGRHMAGRLQSSKRPLLQDGMSDWRRIYDERKPLYREVASLTIDTSSLSLKAIVEQIEKALA
jgi:shikimate kinase